MKKKIIFYQPICETSKVSKQSGTILRPLKIKMAFESIGIKVISISGTHSNRLSLVKKIMNNQFESDYFDYVYAETTNIPMFLSNKNHISINPLTDFINLFKLSKKYKIGLFYRDIHWKHKSYFNEVGFIKGLFLKILFYIEYWMLVRIVDIIFVPSSEFINKLPKTRFQLKFEVLPPGCEEPFLDIFDDCSTKDQKKAFYSGNIDPKGLYNISNLLNLFKNYNKNIQININTTYDAINSNKTYYSKYFSENIVFTSYEYEERNLINDKFCFAIIWQDGIIEDMEIYMPIKMFYYMSLGLPIIGRKHTAYGNFIENNEIGWTYDGVKDLQSLIIYLINNPEQLKDKNQNLKEVFKLHTWKARVNKINECLL